VQLRHKIISVLPFRIHAQNFVWIDSSNILVQFFVCFQSSAKKTCLYLVSYDAVFLLSFSWVLFSVTLCPYFYELLCIIKSSVVKKSPSLLYPVCHWKHENFCRPHRMCRECCCLCKCSDCRQLWPLFVYLCVHR